MQLLNGRQLRFIEEYQVDLCAAKAAERAGYSAKSAKSIGSRLLGRPAVAAALREARDRRSGAVALKREEIEGELRRIALSAEERTADRLRALELAGRSIGMFLDKSELTVSSFEELVLAADRKCREREEHGNGARSEAETADPTPTASTNPSDAQGLSAALDGILPKAKA